MAEEIAPRDSQNERRVGTDDVKPLLPVGYDASQDEKRLGTAPREHVADLRQAGRKHGVESRTEALRLLAGGSTPGEVCKVLGVPRGTLSWWKRSSPEYARAYAHAIRSGADHLAADTVEISDACPAEKDEVNRARLRVQARQWLAGRYAPEMYGDRVEIQHSGEVEVRRTRFKSLLGDRKHVQDASFEVSDEPGPEA
jgi:hypothetical protein